MVRSSKTGIKVVWNSGSPDQRLNFPRFLISCRIDPLPLPLKRFRSREGVHEDVTGVVIQRGQNGRCMKCVASSPLPRVSAWHPTPPRPHVAASIARSNATVSHHVTICPRASLALRVAVRVAGTRQERATGTDQASPHMSTNQVRCDGPARAHVYKEGEVMKNISIGRSKSVSNRSWSAE